jgi:hypothetical protein
MRRKARSDKQGTSRLKRADSLVQKLPASFPTKHKVGEPLPCVETRLASVVKFGRDYIHPEPTGTIVIDWRRLIPAHSPPDAIYFKLPIVRNRKGGWYSDHCPTNDIPSIGYFLEIRCVVLDDHRHIGANPTSLVHDPYCNCVLCRIAEYRGRVINHLAG